MSVFENIEKLEEYISNIQNELVNVKWESKEPATENGDSEIAPSWKNDSQCYKCSVKFSWGYGIFEAVCRHHCRNCGVSACDKHSNNFKSLKHLNLEGPQRVCDNCLAQLPPDSIDNAIETGNANVYGQNAIKESELYKDHVNSLTEHMKICSNYLTSLNDDVSESVALAQRDMTILSTGIPALKKKIEISIELAKNDVPTNEVNGSVISFKCVVVSIMISKCSSFIF